MTPTISQDPGKQATWDIEGTHPSLLEPLDLALREVIDPEIGLNIIELGLVRNVVLDQEAGKAHVTMIMTTPFCPYAPALLEMARTKTEEAVGHPATIEMGMELWDVSYMEEGAGADWGLF
ncbi:MAG: metal-sulfur cluster assembly factor [Anaerolineae bacterium]|nr:metal-sulfur cluster assembly factor [Anaerolineae bacterium]